MNELTVREIFESSVDFLSIPDAIWHEDEQRYTIFSQKQFAWEIFKEAFKLGTLYGRN